MYVEQMDDENARIKINVECCKLMHDVNVINFRTLLLLLPVQHS